MSDISEAFVRNMDPVEPQTRGAPDPADVAQAAEDHKLSTDTKYRAVSFIETYSGRAFYPLRPRVEDVSVIDIAHHLANQCRYSGATRLFYSTAQHCCLLADFVMQRRNGTALDGLEILMHDGAETYLVDVPRPIKQFLPDYRKWDHTLTMTIREWMGLKDRPLPKWQDEFDSRIIVDERLQVMSDSGLDWQHDLVPLDINIDPWDPQRAEQEFLKRYAVLSLEHYGTHQYLRSGWGVSMDSNFRTGGSDIAQYGEANPAIITDLLEVDLRGGVGRVALRSPDGMMIRDTRAGKFPLPAWKFIHGKFDLIEGSANGLG